MLRRGGQAITANRVEYLEDASGVGHLIIVQAVAYPPTIDGVYKLTLMTCCTEPDIPDYLEARLADAVTCFACSARM